MRTKRFQVHLSTAVVLMFAAGMLLWANVSPRTEYCFVWTVGFPQRLAFYPTVHEAELNLKSWYRDRAPEYWVGKLDNYGWPEKCGGTLQSGGIRDGEWRGDNDLNWGFKYPGT